MRGGDSLGWDCASGCGGLLDIIWNWGTMGTGLNPVRDRKSGREWLDVFA